MRKLYKKILSYFYPLIFGILLFIVSKSQASTNPYGDTGVDLKQGFKQKDMFNVKSETVKSVQLEADQVQFSPDSNKASR